MTRVVRSDGDAKVAVVLVAAMTAAGAVLKLGTITQGFLSTLFALMKRNDRSATLSFDIPHNRVVKLGTRVEL